jgi:hypothetical protein
MKNRDIQFYFKRPGRAVNSGRITDIAAGTYSDSAETDRAWDEEFFTHDCRRNVAGVYVSLCPLSRNEPLRLSDRHGREAAEVR